LKFAVPSLRWEYDPQGWGSAAVYQILVDGYGTGMKHNFDSGVSGLVHLARMHRRIAREYNAGLRRILLLTADDEAMFRVLQNLRDRHASKADAFMEAARLVAAPDSVLA